MALIKCVLYLNELLTISNGLPSGLLVLNLFGNKNVAGFENKLLQNVYDNELLLTILSGSLLSY